ncbi:uncharacterized protein V3H82_006586 [Fundulus diaphanus]
MFLHNIIFSSAAPALITIGGHGNHQKNKDIPDSTKQTTTRWQPCFSLDFETTLGSLSSLPPPSCRRPYLQRQAVGNPPCRGVWRRAGRLEASSCRTSSSASPSSFKTSSSLFKQG